MMKVYRMLQASGGTVATKVIPYEDEGDEEEPPEHHGGVDAKDGGSSLSERLMTVVQPRRCNLFVLL